MAKINLSAKIKDKNFNFRVDCHGCFVQSDSNGKDSIILDNMTGEFDGLCDEYENLHFLLQSQNGELIYLKYDGKTWKKYLIFKSKENIACISNIHMTLNGDKLCGFYSMSHKGNFLLIKHCFSVKSLYTTPDVAAILDVRKCFCMCTDTADNTHLYYRDSHGAIRKNVYNTDFTAISQGGIVMNEDIYSLDVCYASDGFMYAYTTNQKGYTVLKFKKEGSEEKIITFGSAKNIPISILHTDNTIEICWQEGKFVLSSKSFDGGSTFDKPTIKSTSSGKTKTVFKEIKDNADIFSNIRRKTDMYNQKRGFSDTPNRPISPSELVYHLNIIEKTIIKIGKDTEKICNLLDNIIILKNESEIAEFPPKSENKSTDCIKITNEDIGEINEENVKLFESMEITDTDLAANNEDASK